jgi:DNA-binding GntR family transcriptional regulator
VAALTIDSVRHLFELMSALEGLSGELAATRHTAEDLREIRALHFEMLAAHARADLPGYYRLNRAIHRAINRSARNPMLAEAYDSVNLRIQNLRFRSNFKAEKWDAAVAEHQAMLEALMARDPVRLRQQLEQHLRHKLQAVLDSFNLQDPSP